MASDSDDRTRIAGPGGDDLTAALNRAAATPLNVAHWEAAEALAATLGRPDELAVLYRQTLKKGGPAVMGVLGRRALAFHEEWFGDTPEPIIELLEGLLELDPTLDWAAERLTLLLSVSQRWEDLLTAYDRLLANSKDGPRRRKLLEEAAGVAKDFLGSAERAIGYLTELFRSKPGDPHVGAALERLLDKEQRWTELEAVWTTRLEVLSGGEHVELRGRLATLRLEKLGNVAGALSDAHALLKAREDAAARKILERILKMPTASSEQRQAALSLLRNDYERLGDKGRFVEALESAHEFASGEEKLRLLREASERMVAEDKIPVAMDRLVELLTLAPQDAPARIRLRQLAEVSERFDVYVRGLLAAAEAAPDTELKCALRLEAARVLDETLGRHSEATALLVQVADQQDADQGQQLTALRRLAKVLSRFGEPAQRLEVVQRLAQLAPEAPEQQTYWGQAAKLAAQLGHPERALAAWQKRLELDSTDPEALDVLAVGYEHAGKWEQLADVLRARAEQSVRAEVKRADLVRLAQVLSSQLQNPANAAEVWQEVERRFGEDAVSAQALVELFGVQGRWQEAADRLESTAVEQRAQLLLIYVQWAEVLSERLNQPASAARVYALALALQPSHAGAQQGLQRLAVQAEAPAEAIEALARAYQQSEDIPALVALTDLRLSRVVGPLAQARLLADVADQAESVNRDAPTARLLLGKALKLAPDDTRLENELLRLSTDVTSWRVAAENLAEAASALPDENARKSQLHVQRARLLETRLEEPEAALQAYEAALRLAPERNDLKLALVRLAGARGDWLVAAEAVLRTPVSTEIVKGQLLPAFEAAVEQGEAADAWTGAAQALEQVLVKRTGLPEALARDLELTLATWGEANIKGPQGRKLAESALLRATKQNPLHVPTWERLARLQRQQPGRALLETLQHLAALTPESLDAASESMKVAETLSDSPALLRQGWATLSQISHLLRGDTVATGKVDVGTAAEQAVASVTSVLLATGHRQDAGRAVNMMMEVAHWNLPPQLLRGLRRKAARITLEVLGDKARARTLYRTIIDDAPDDREAIGVLASLLEEADLLSELLALRRRELTLDLSVSERIALRLDMSRLAGLMEERSARVSTLLANLQDAPGDEGTLEALHALLVAKGQYKELADIFTTEARTLDESQLAAKAAPLWGRVAVLAEQHLSDPARASSAYEKMVAVTPSAHALDALARLALRRGEPRAAAAWLEQRLAAADGLDRVDVSLQLAQCYADSGQRHRAIGSLERTLAEVPHAHAVRARLIETYRQSEAWEPLARTLAEGCAHSANDEALLSYAREAATLYQEKLGQPERAVPALELAVQRAPGDRNLRTLLAQGLRQAGRNTQARKLLEDLLEEMGRRRSRERAAIHHQLALVARAEGDLVAALEHLDQAAAMDVGGQQVLVDLAETAEQAKNLDRAERAYQALLVLARRSEPGEAPLSAAEILMRLEAVAVSRGDAGAAAERWDSAMAAALQGADEAQRLQQALVARGEIDRAVQLLERRAAAAATGADEARVLCDRAQLFRGLDRLEDAMAAVALALDKAPDLSTAHDLGRQVAQQLGDPQRYLRLLEESLEQMRRRDDGARVSGLLMRAGAVAEQDVRDLAKAAVFYSRAEQTGHGVLEALVAQARVAGAKGDASQVARAQRELSRMAQQAATPKEQAEIGFQLAALQLRLAETRAAGLETLSAALDKDPDFARAQSIVREAQVPEEELPAVMPLYERVARASGVDRMLLDFLERRAAAKEATQAEVSEAVELALAIGENPRAERLLERAVAISEQHGQPRDAGWALLDLAHRRRAQGDLRAAFKWAVEAAQATDSPRIPNLLRDIAREAAAQPEGAELAAEVYENLRARNPGDKELWQPLIDLYGQLGDEARLRAVVADTLEKLLDRHDRVRVRLVWARHLLATGHNDEEASSAFRDILLEEPGNREALRALAELHERRGDVSEAVALLSDSLREAETRGDADWQAETSRHLGDLLRKADPGQAKQVYRQALASNIPDATLKRSLQKSLFDLLDDDEAEERAQLAEELLATEDGDEAAERALQVSAMYKGTGDVESERRMLEQGRRRAPHNTQIFERLTSLLEAQQNWDAWSALMHEEATRRADSNPEDAANILRRAATTRREKLGDAAGAATLLKKAATLATTDVEHVRELAVCLRQMGDSPGAIEAVDDALDRPNLPAAARVVLYRLRADLHTEAGDAQAAVADLEGAFDLGGLTVAEELTDALFLLTSRALEAHDTEAERKGMLRLTEIFTLQGNTEKAQDLLFRWVDNHPEDQDALQALRGRFEAAEQWEDVARVCERLVAMDTGEGRIEAALGLAHAYEQIGRPAEAVPTLEHVLADYPGQPAILNILSSMYEQAGNRRKVAELRIQAADRLTNEQERLDALTEGADILLQEGDPEAAVVAINKAFALRPEDRVVQRLLADTLLATGQYAQAAKLLDRLVGDGRGLDGGETSALYHRMARACGGLGDSAEQLTALRKALDADRRNGVVASELADLAEQLGDDDLALKALRAISLNCPDGPMPVAVSFFRQARIAAKNGDRQRALIFAKRALQEDPTLVEAEQLLNQVR